MGKLQSTTDGCVWDLSSYFPSFDGPEMRAFAAQLRMDLDRLLELGGSLGCLSFDNIDGWEEVLLLAEDWVVRRAHLQSYTHSMFCSDTSNEQYAAASAAIGPLAADYIKLDTQVLNGIYGADPEVVHALVARPALAGMQHYISRLHQRAVHMMGLDEEALVADLNVAGLQGWDRLYDSVSSKLKGTMEWPDGHSEELPVAKLRSLTNDIDRRIGRRAYQANARAWSGAAHTCAAALNAITGLRITLAGHRGWRGPLEASLLQNGMSAETLEAMYTAVHSEVELPRELRRIKGRYLGQTGVYWFEREAPLPLHADSPQFTWDEGVALVLGSLEPEYPRLAAYGKEMLRRGWVDSLPRSGKRQGAFCTSSPLTKQQRIYMSYHGGLGDITTFAHELGHAWHTNLLNEVRPRARHCPLPFNESASLFSEYVFARGFMLNPIVSSSHKLSMTEELLSRGAALLLELTMRFKFERALYQHRRQGELSVTRLNALMEEVKHEVYGDCLLYEEPEPLLWAGQMHYYVTDAAFYNYSYTFGFLLARALAARLETQGPAFLEQFENFLRRTGQCNLEEVAMDELGIDTTDPVFWVGAIRTLEAPLLQFKAELDRLTEAERAAYLASVEQKSANRFNFQAGLALV
jgi:oligoendopeptidase F